MKLLRYDLDGVARVGVVKGDGIVDLAGLDATFPTMLSIIEGGPEALAKIDRLVASVASTPTVPLAGALKLPRLLSKHVRQIDTLAPADTCVSPVLDAAGLAVDAQFASRGTIVEATVPAGVRGDGVPDTFRQVGPVLAGMPGRGDPV